MAGWREDHLMMIACVMVVSIGAACAGSGEDDRSRVIDGGEASRARPPEDTGSILPGPGDTRSILPAPDAQEPATSMVTGSLEDVDVDAQTLTVVDNDRQLRVSFSEETDVQGVAGAQGLAAREGNTVTVTYRHEGDTMIAERIIVLQ